MALKMNVIALLIGVLVALAACSSVPEPERSLSLSKGRRVEEPLGVRPQSHLNL